VDNYDLVLEYLLSEGYSHKEATRIMVNLDEGFIQDLWKAAQKRFSSPKSIARAGAADVAATAIATTPAQSARPTLPPQPAPIIRQVAAPVTQNSLQQVAAPFKKVRNIVRQLNPAKPTAGSLPQGKPGGSVVPASKPGAVTPSAKPASGISNTGGSSVATTTGSGQVSTTGANVRTPAGPLTKAGPVVDVQARLSGSSSVQRLSPGQVRNFRPSVRLTGGGGAAVSGSTASNVLGALKYVPHVAAAAIGLNAGPVADGTLKGALKRGEYKPVQGPPAPKAPEKKPEVQQVVTKNKFVPRVKQPERPRVDADLQRYRDLVKKGKKMTVYDRKEAEDLGRDIYQRYRNPALYQPKTA
jgi:hypothetical protein